MIGGSSDIWFVSKSLKTFRACPDVVLENAGIFQIAAAEVVALDVARRALQEPFMWMVDITFNTLRCKVLACGYGAVALRRWW